MKDDQRAAIADLRDKCKTLAGAVMEWWPETMQGEVSCVHCNASALLADMVIHTPDCPVQIAREVKG